MGQIGNHRSLHVVHPGCTARSSPMQALSKSVSSDETQASRAATKRAIGQMYVPATTTKKINSKLEILRTTWAHSPIPMYR